MNEIVDPLYLIFLALCFIAGVLIGK